MSIPLLLLSFLPLLSDSLCVSSSCDKYLRSSDFSNGTFRINSSGIYCLSEDIIFNPLPGNILTPNSKFNWFPNDESRYPACSALKNGPFALGFFAAITIETDNVEIDLCEFEISQHFHFYIEQRFFSLIEIGSSPFLSNMGPTNFGPVQPVNNIFIHNGKLGLSSHHAIHSNEAHKVRIQDLNIYNFEVAGLQFNGFTDVTIKNVDIGPSATNVVASGYYSNAKYVLLAFKKLLIAISDNKENVIISDHKVIFSGNRELTLNEIYINLLTSMDIAFRYFIDASTDNDINNELYLESINLYSNPNKLPDGSTLYGLVMHSKNIAVLGFGNFQNEAGDGESVVIQNVTIHDLQNSLNEIPAIYFNKCDNPKTNDMTPLKGPFADVMDIRKMVDNEHINIIDNGGDYTSLQYKGNPLSDAQIALALYGAKYGDNLQYGSNGMGQHSHFLQWALNQYEGNHYKYLPQCTSFMCNGDIMLHTNKGIIGARFDLIEDVKINNLHIANLYNKSPISSYACKNYTGEHDGGSQGQLDSEGSMGTDVKGLTVYGGDILFEGNNKIDGVKSDYGSAMGMHLMYDAEIYIDDIANIDVISDNIICGVSLNKSLLNGLIKDNKYPYPNNFRHCNVLLNDKEEDNVQIFGTLPNGINPMFCKQNAMVQHVVDIHDSPNITDFGNEPLYQTPNMLILAYLIAIYFCLCVVILFCFIY